MFSCFLVNFMDTMSTWKLNCIIVTSNYFFQSKAKYSRLWAECKRHSKDNVRMCAELAFKFWNQWVVLLLLKPFKPLNFVLLYFIFFKLFRFLIINTYLIRLWQMKIKGLRSPLTLCPILSDLGMQQFARLTPPWRVLTCDVKLKKSRSSLQRKLVFEKNGVEWWKMITKSSCVVINLERRQNDYMDLFA